MTTAGAEVERHALPPATKMFESAQMRFGEVLDMNVVANRRPIGGLVIGSIDLHLLAAPKRGLHNKRDEMRFRLVPLADFALRVGPGGIKIA